MDPGSKTTKSKNSMATHGEAQRAGVALGHDLDGQQVRAWLSVLPRISGTQDDERMDTGQAQA